jgi:hypothetical protein
MSRATASDIAALGSMFMMGGAVLCVVIACLLFLPLLITTLLSVVASLYSYGISGSFGVFGGSFLTWAPFPLSLFLSVWIVVDGIPLINEPRARAFATLALRSGALAALSYVAFRAWL